MTILRDISMLWSMFHTLVLFFFLFESRYPKKKAATIVMLTMIPLIIVNLILFAVLGFDSYGTLMLATLSLPSCVILFLLSKHRDGRFFFTFCMVDTIILEIVYITNLLNPYISPSNYIFMFIVRILGLPLLELWVYRKLRPIYLEVQKKSGNGWGIFAIIGFLFYIVITLLMTYPDNIANRPHQIPALILMFILMPVIYIHIISALRRQQLYYEQDEQERIMQLQVSNITERVNELGEANEAFRKERHDFRHKLKVIASLVETKQYDELDRIVKEYETNIHKTQVVRYCKSAVVDAVLSIYINRAKNSGIDVKLGFAFPDSYEANESELATALANAVENAIHACEKLPQNERFIEIKVLSKPKFIVMVRNSFDGNVEFDENGIPQTREEGHGIGTLSIVAFCEKVGGYYEFNAEDKVFTLFMHLK
ncbi:MAG: GHKL domain-containing protein [Clostridia bacterium]|nr:GHKL domain-containing protein [Clostridia bacterium]